MYLLEIVKSLEGRSTRERFELITQMLNQWHIPHKIQSYASGRNILVQSYHKKWIGIGSHIDAVRNSPGANDNASAIAVCLEILHRMQENAVKHTGVSVFFFDEEETGLKGSKAYVGEYGIKNMMGLINLEMVGMGDRFALWPLDALSQGKVLQTFEQVAADRNIFTRRFDKIVTNTADHVSFANAGSKDVFSLTCISEKDVDVAYHYYKAQEFDVDMETLRDIMKQAPIFQHYHQPTDLSIYLSEESLQLTANTLWQTLLALDRR
ncbi:Zn-dependent exopeptidase M28 [Rhodocytophaga rosea]|uniref:Zn-dependent exopeptidase M28 n=1 Tax=Rhodocytophaga rosea TaxID=2704465 RepID=A0A6C0GPU8_9BACT|nr:M20/M25/M40 family metallo-hydrolase [Rhodocytophaga rosea]QHT70095.1 Zn-dependent exopeptidase M28 [Rhodocytophaga rosea]